MFVKENPHKKTTDINDLVKIADFDVKIGEIKKKILNHDQGVYFSTQEVNQSTADGFVARLKQENLTNKIDIGDFVKKSQILMKK